MNMENMQQAAFIKPKHRLEGQWTLLRATNYSDSCFKLFKKGEFKMTSIHNNISRRCTVHANMNDHKNFFFIVCPILPANRSQAF